MATGQPVCLAIAVAAIGWTIESWWEVDRQQGHGNIRSPWRLAMSRNITTYRLAWWVAALVVVVGLALVDSLGYLLARKLLLDGMSRGEVYTWFGSMVALALSAGPLMRWIAGLLVTQKAGANEGLLRSLASVPYLPTMAVLSLGALLPLILLSFVSHVLFGLGFEYGRGLAATGVALGVSLLVGNARTLPFINRSGPLTIYAARLARVFLGAVNPNRYRRVDQANVAHVIEGDDLPFAQYRPHAAGGPLHLFNVALNEWMSLRSGAFATAKPRIWRWGQPA